MGSLVASWRRLVVVLRHHPFVVFGVVGASFLACHVEFNVQACAL